jgi:hypothetical protein
LEPVDDMQSCGAAIIHVDADNTIVDKDDNEHAFLNPNVLIEIGGAMETLDADATIKLLEAIKDIKNYALPSEGAKPTGET